MPTLEWIGKNKVVNHHLEVPFCTLEKKYDFGDDASRIVQTTQNTTKQDASSPNMIIHGDNLLALKSLLPQYAGKVKCIYIDPPYNTGNENWVYNDNVNDPKIKKWLGQVVGTEEVDLTRHDKWLCMMYPRLKLLQKLLSDDGAIFISIDDNEQANLKLICDEIFGSRNFVANVIWQHSIQPKGYTDKFSIHHNQTFVYQKSDLFILKSLERTEEDNKAYKNPDNDPRGLWRSGDVRNALYRPNLIYDIKTPSGKIIHAPEKGWRWSKETVAEKMKTGEIIFNKDETNIIRKIYLNTVEGRAPETIWFGKDVGTTREATNELKEIFDNKPSFDTPKPTRLIERILQISTSPNSIILDSFAGSGTTAHAVLNLNKADGGNRRFILVEMQDYAESITAERVKRVITGYGEGTKKTEGTGGSFSFYELGQSLFIGDTLNEEISAEKIREYVYYTETKQALQTKADEPYFMGTYLDNAYYFLYKKKEITTLNLDFLETIKTKASAYIIYADRCTLGEVLLKQYNITFKKIPRDITRL